MYGNVNTDRVWGCYAYCKKVKWHILETLGRRKYLLGTNDGRGHMYSAILLSVLIVFLSIFTVCCLYFRFLKNKLTITMFAQSFTYE